MTRSIGERRTERNLWVPRTVSRRLTRAFVVAQAR
jgi:hypothetical protein